jgi:hypothetical protein
MKKAGGSFFGFFLLLSVCLIAPGTGAWRAGGGSSLQDEFYGKVIDAAKQGVAEACYAGAKRNGLGYETIQSNHHWR